MYTCLGLTTIVIGSILVINQLQERYPAVLPSCLRSWSFLPLWMRSLEPLDDLFKRMSCCSSCLTENGGDCCDAVQQTCQEVRRDVEAAIFEKESLMAQKTNNLAAITIVPLHQRTQGGDSAPAVAVPSASLTDSDSCSV